jgi:hypothetical protein
LRKFFAILFWSFLALYVVALDAFLGLLLGIWHFGTQAGALLVPLGMPWMLIFDTLPVIAIGVFSLQVWATPFAPLINLLILYLMLRWAGRRDRRT